MEKASRRNFFKSDSYSNIAALFLASNLMLKLVIRGDFWVLKLIQYFIQPDAFIRLDDKVFNQQRPGLFQVKIKVYFTNT